MSHNEFVTMTLSKLYKRGPKWGWKDSEPTELELKIYRRAIKDIAGDLGLAGRLEKSIK